VGSDTATDMRCSMARGRAKSAGIASWPKDGRPRERLLAGEKLSEAELLATILRAGQSTFKAGVRGRNATDFARSLLKDFSGLRGLDRAHVQARCSAVKRVCCWVQ
jgi:DNA repair protein RadC